MDLHAFVDDQLHAHLAEQLHGRGHIVQMRHVGDADRLIGEQTGGEDRQNGVLGAGNLHVTLQRLTAIDYDFGHGQRVS